MREVVQDHFYFLQGILLLNSISPTHSLNKAYEKSVSTFFSYCIRSKRVQSIFWRESFLIYHVVYPHFKVMVKLHVCLQDFVKVSFKLRVRICVIVSEHLLKKTLLQILIEELGQVYWYRNKFIFFFLNQLSMTNAYQIIPYITRIPMSCCTQSTLTSFRLLRTIVTERRQNFNHLIFCHC